MDNHHNDTFPFTSRDGEFVKTLREKLEPKGIATWVDSREWVGGNKPEPEIEGAISMPILPRLLLSSPDFKKAMVRRRR